MAAERIHFVGSDHLETPQAMAELISCYGQAELASADMIVALGGDGFLLRVLHQHATSGLPVYGMRMGRIGFLMNRYQSKPQSINSCWNWPH